jgi:hypothetical protein
MERNRKLALAIGFGAVALLVFPILAQRGPTTGPVARYDMRAGTVSGFGAMGSGMGAAMRMMRGGGGNNRVQHELYLRLGSTQAPAKGAPKADHFMPAGAQLGKSVALVTPVQERGPADELPGEREGRKPTGKILLFWGCGERAPKGQPFVIDLAKLTVGQVPPGLWTSTVIRDWGPNLQNSKTFGRWPAEDGEFAKPDSTLPGAHRVAGNYSPEIAFTLAKDFMPAINLTTTAQPSGATLLSWGAIPEATGYMAYLFGGKRGPNGDSMDMVMWTSSAGRQFGGGLMDWITTAQAAALVKDRTLLPPTAISCTVPADVKAAAPDFRMGQLIAHGPQEDFAHPPRPADPKAAWNLQWTVRVRHRSMTSWVDMPGMPEMASQPQSQQQQPKCKPKGGLGGLLGGVLKPGC